MTDQPNDAERIEIPPLTGILTEPFSIRKLIKMMSYFGPAAVVASLSLGAGETIMATGLGAWSEYDLLWLLILSVVVKGVFVMYLMGRYTAITGQRCRPAVGDAARSARLAADVGDRAGTRFDEHGADDGCQTVRQPDRLFAARSVAGRLEFRDLGECHYKHCVRRRHGRLPCSARSACWSVNRSSFVEFLYSARSRLRSS